MVKSKYTFFAMLIVVYTLSFAVCSLNFNDVGRHAKKDQLRDIYCGADLMSYSIENEQNSFLIDLTQCWSLPAQDNEPHLPILSFAIFKVPKPA